MGRRRTKMPKPPASGRPARRRTQEERSTETRAKLIRATIDLICRHGYANLTTPDIASAAGVSRGALQHHFATRYELIAAVNDQLTNDMVALGEELEAANLPLARRVDAVVERYLSVYTSPTYLAILNISLGIRDDTMRRRVRRHVVDVFRKSDAPWLALFGDTGLPPRDLVALRRMTLAALRGLAMVRFLDIQREPIDAELDALKTVLVDRLARGRGRTSDRPAA
jgi:AcrR family transcriptional regulator